MGVGVTYPAREFRIVLGPLGEGAAAPVRDGDFTAADKTVGDRERRIHLYDFGPGDPYRLETHVSIQRAPDGAYTRDANVDCQVSAPPRTP